MARHAYLADRCNPLPCRLDGTLGASGLEPHWQMMGALEGMDGMLLFGISTAYIFAINAALLVTDDPRPPSLN